MSLIITDRGDPVPPQGVVKLLREFDRTLEVRWVKGLTNYFGIFQHWREDDPRWESVRAGTTDPRNAVDLLGTLPKNCSLYEALAYVQRTLKMNFDPKAEAERLTRDVDAANAATRQAHVDDVRTELLEEAERTSYREMKVLAGAESAGAFSIVPSDIGTAARRDKAERGR